MRIIKYNGWLFAPIRYMKMMQCGMIYGHTWKPVTPEVQGKIGCECQRCNKFKVF